MFFSTLRQTNRELRRIAESLEDLAFLLRSALGLGLRPMTGDGLRSRMDQDREVAESDGYQAQAQAQAQAQHQAQPSVPSGAVFYAQSDELDELYRGQEMDALQSYWFSQGQAQGRAEAMRAAATLAAMEPTGDKANDESQEG